MCDFKSGIILRKKCVLTDGTSESHSELLEKLKIEDSFVNASKVFVRAELLPPDNEWWTDPATWKFVVDQDILPDWFEIDRDEYEQKFRDEVKLWIDAHTIKNKELDTLDKDFYILINCSVKTLSGNVCVMIKDTTIQDVREKSCIKQMSGLSIVKSMNDNAKIMDMYDNSQVFNIFGNSCVNVMHDDSKIEFICVYGEYGKCGVYEMKDRASIICIAEKTCISGMYDNSVIKSMIEGSKVAGTWDNACICTMSNSSCISQMRDMSRVNKMENDSYVDIVSDNSEIKQMTENSFVNSIGINVSIEEMKDNSLVKFADGHSVIKSMHEHAEVLEMREFSSVKEVFDEAIAKNYETKTIYIAKESGFKTSYKFMAKTHRLAYGMKATFSLT